ncbi:back seat driver isoform X2 [Musca autumnalis]|uniref:back seat driver isoform X2 n=1 Tax=Musca autumnalis TaxID=221902 RepID=UPI003CE6705C
MGKRVVVESHDHHHQQHSNNHHHVTPVTTGARNIRKRKCNSNGNANTNHSSDKITNKAQRMSSSSGHEWHENDDEDSSSNDGPPEVVQTPRNLSSKQANNSSILLNNSLNVSLANEPNASLTESPKPVYTLRPSVVNGTVLYDLNEKPWRLGRPIGKGNFGEIFLASDNISIPVTNENAKFVVKIEPHSNGPLFVEIHCLMNTAKKDKFIKTEPKAEENHHHHNKSAVTPSAANSILSEPPSGIPDYIASGSHFFGNARYRFLVLPRFDRDLHSLIKKCRVHQKSVLTLAIHIINVLENLHDKGYCHNDVKAQNLMISKCKYFAQPRKSSASGFSTTTTTTKNNGKHIKSSSKYDDHYEEKQQTTDSGNSSEQEANDDDDEDFVVKRKVYNKVIDENYDDDDEEEEDNDDDEEDDDDDDEDFDDGATTNSTNSNSLDNYRTPVNKRHTQKRKTSRNVVPYSGSNPVRSCRREKSNPMYDEMVSSHYLRPTKRVSYLEFFNEDNASNSNGIAEDMRSLSSDEESEEFLPPGSAKKSSASRSKSRRLTRRQEQLLAANNKKHSSIKASKQQIVDKDEKKKPIKMETPEEQQQRILVEEERIFLIDYGLASKFMDNGIHRPFVMDQRRAHDGTLEFTSRDAHMGAHSRRSDMECLGYNLLFWSQGYLPWKEAATNQQQEKVHRAKEYLMTDVREMLRQIYGKQVPKYLGEYLHLVGQLNYHERPDYNRYRRLFEREYEQLGYPLADMQLQMTEIQRTCVRVKEEIENKNDFFDMNRANGVFNLAYNVMQTAVGGTPFHERTLSNRVSPKNLRSKSDKKAPKKKKFSWTEILSQDPDLIARERAEREFDREEELSDVQQDIVRRYQGKPTYAIRQVLHRMGCPIEEYEKQRDDEEKARHKNKTKQKKEEEEENDIEVDACDGGVGENSEPMEVDDEHESEDAETDATDASEQQKTTNSRRQKSNGRVRSSTTTTKRTKVGASRKLILKTPNSLPSEKPNAADDTPDTQTERRTTRKRYASKVKLSTPSNSTPVSSIVNGGGCSSTTTKTAKSAAKPTSKRGSAITKSSRKTAITATPAAASAAGEVEQQEPQTTNATKRERRTRRCLLKTEQYGGLLDDDSNSNYTPEGYAWKGGNNTESVYTRNCRK